MSDTFTTKLHEGQDVPLRWQDQNGVMHAVEGSDVHPGVTLLWPRCGCCDVPANAGWLGFDAVTCAACEVVA